MAKLSIKAIVSALQSILPGAKTASGNGTGVDLQGYDAALCIVSFGTWTDGTHTLKLQESDDNSSYTDVAAGDLDGSFTAVSSGAGSNTIQMVGYIGRKRYIRAVTTVGSASTGAVYEAMIVRGAPRHI